MQTSDHAWARGTQVFRGSLPLTHMVPSASVDYLYALRFPPTPSTRVRIDAGGAQLPKEGATPPLACSLQSDVFLKLEIAAAAARRSVL